MKRLLLALIVGLMLLATVGSALSYHDRYHYNDGGFVYGPWGWAWYQPQHTYTYRYNNYANYYPRDYFNPHYTSYGYYRTYPYQASYGYYRYQTGMYNYWPYSYRVYPRYYW